MSKAPSTPITGPHYFDVSDDVECMVGWDSPLGSFFGQVYKIDAEGERVPSEDGGMLLWVGAEPNKQIRGVAELQRQLQPLVPKLPKEIYDKLYTVEID